MTVSQVREALDGAALLAWARDCRTDLDRRRAEIDALNVFPIADADTGTNLLATMRAAVAAAEDVVVADASNATHVVAQALARGATLGARGNSGIILSQVLRGIAEAVRSGPLTGDRLRVALRRAAVLVRTGLSAPVEGTILTVLDRAAVAAAASADTVLVTVARAAAEGAARALNETPAQLGVLRAAGVVDAGARGLLVLLDCLVSQISGEAPHRGVYARDRADRDDPVSSGRTTARDRTRGAGDPDGATDDKEPRAALSRSGDDEAGSGPARGGIRGAGHPADGSGDERSGGGVDRRAGDSEDAGGSSEPVGPESALDDKQRDLGDRAEGWFESADQVSEPHFEVMYVISGTDEEGADALRDRLAVLGDSVVVVGDGDSTWSAHVHCRDAGAAIEAGIGVGHLTRIRVESFAVTAPHGGSHEHHAESAPPAGHPAATVSADDPAPGYGPADRGILAVVAGADAARLFEDAGAVVLRGDRQLDTGALLAAIRAMPHREVLVLPNGALPAQELVAVGVAARDGSRDVLLLPSSSVVQGLAALAVHDRGRIAVDDAFAMSEAAATTRWGALRAASVRALTMVGTCSPGDGLGLVGHDVVVIDPDVVGAGRILLDRMLGLGGELVTLLMGADAGPELARVLGEHVTAGFPGVEVVVYSGGQQADLVQIGVE
ncbi:DAK2 domain-containing protein [Nocardia sp. NPDC058176]|uniref:DAK2 domain-containing protein n=1 Tax=Nocardia sp. NPDC058176 TaxID=3346368 RepID=UPI0036DB4B67